MLREILFWLLTEAIKKMIIRQPYVYKSDKDKK